MILIIFFYTIVNVTKCITLLLYHIIKHINLLCLKIDDSILINRFKLLSYYGWS